MPWKRVWSRIPRSAANAALETDSTKPRGPGCMPTIPDSEGIATGRAGGTDGAAQAPGKERLQREAEAAARALQELR